MTFTADKRVACGHCGNHQAVTQLLSMTLFGDQMSALDLRPLDDRWLWIEMQVAACERCGYASRDLARPPSPDAAAVIGQPRYRAALDHPSHAPLARRFAATAMLDEVAGQHGLAAAANLAAAWTCDDASNPDAARMFRSRAAAQLLQAHTLHQRMGSSVEQDLAVLADIFRRMGDFAQAAQTAQRALCLPSPTDHDDTIGDMLQATLELAHAGHADVECVPHPDATTAARRAQRERELAKQREQVAREKLASTVPRNVPAALQAVMPIDDDAASTLDPSCLRRLHLPDGVADEVIGHVNRSGWPLRATLGALGVALLRVLPDLPGCTEDMRTQWGNACATRGDLVEYLAYCFRKSSLDAWHYWPPFPPGNGPSLPRG